MAPPVYSTQFLDFSVVNVDIETFTVPDGFRAVVRDISATLNSHGARDCIFTVYAGSAGLVWWNIPPRTQSSGHWVGHAVVNPGETIVATNENFGTGADYKVSGYLLSAPL